MPSTFLNVLIFSSIAGLATLSGVFLVLYHEKYAKKYSTYLISFAAGALLTSAFTNLIPESLELYTNALLIVLAGFLIFYLMEYFIIFHSCIGKECNIHETTGRVAAIGIGFHSFIDGLAIGVGFGVSQTIGIIATVAVLLHEFPEGITTMSILIHEKVKRNLAILYSVLVALATPIGAIIAFLIIKNISQTLLGALLAIAAGSFIYIAAAGLVPEIHREFNKLNAIVLFLGVIVILLVGFII